MEKRIHAAHAAADWALLERLCRQALVKNRRDRTAHRMLGYALHQRREVEAAVTAYQWATEFWPEDAELLVNYASLLVEQARNVQALPLLEKVVALRPRHSICWAKLAQCCYPMGRHQQGFDASQKALELARNPLERLSGLTQRAIHRRELGQVREAVQDCEQAIALAPSDMAGYANRMLFMLADPACGAQELAAAAQDYALQFEAPLKSLWPDFAGIDRQPWRKLRVGFVSPDFRDHAVMYFVEGLLAQLDRRQFEVFAFYLFPGSDYITQRVERHADHFIRLASRPAQEQAQAIRDQGIDILIDLAGHTGNSGLLAMAHKPAPVQVSWLGFPATTGLQAIDYKFSDDVTDPEGADDQYAEQLYRLPTLFCCYRPLIREPLWRYQPRYQMRPTPAVANGYMTFGSCNNLGKLTDEVLALWGRILQSVPDSCLLIEGKNLGNPETADAYRQRCVSLGIDAGRLELVPLDRSNQYLTYHRIDIALDPFPLTGGTTTFDVLWMGVPIVSMVGESFKSRMGAGMLAHLGRTEWLAQDAEDYVRIARQLAEDVSRLNAVRQGLRAEVEQSVLMREDIFNHHFGEGLRAMWLQWLAQRQCPGDEAAQQQAMQQWLQDFPQQWGEPPVPGVGLEPGLRVPLSEAHQRLQKLVDQAKAKEPPRGGQISDSHWIAVTELAETVLCAVPHDPVALACLAEVEQAHGHADFAVTYMRYAAEAMGLGAIA
ncbi:hypothetical protein GCM10010975_16640 [Comamonas phosphati]|nr:hypothetical protein GCM10010975_16640 [Comamonas phosphati]